MPKKPETYSAMASDEERNAPLVAGSPWPVIAQQAAAEERLPGQPDGVSKAKFLAGIAAQQQAQAESTARAGTAAAPQMVDPQSGLEFRHQLEAPVPGKKYKKDIGYGYN